MTISTELDLATNILKTSDTSRLDAKVLLAYTLQKDRSWIAAHSDEKLSKQQYDSYKSFINRRLNGEPIAYITGTKEFYGRDFIVNKHVLIPRPESESFITMLKDLKTQHAKAINNRERALQRGATSDQYIRDAGFMHSLIDIGTGSGCLAITAKLEHPDMLVTATDTSGAALKVAIQNATKHDVPIIFKKQSLLANDKEGYDIIMANLPYVPTTVNEASIAHEPDQALYSGKDGLNHYRRLFKQLGLKHIRYVMTEGLLEQHPIIEKLAAAANYKLHQTDGLVQLFLKA